MRDSTFDIMKGIGIIAMIIGHCQVPMIIKDFIFVWHMPLFFIISGYFFKPSPIKRYINKNFISLVIPYLITATLLFSLSLLKDFYHKETDPINSFLGIFVAAGSDGLPMLGDYYVGAIWFLLALFWCRTIYNVIIMNSLTQEKGMLVIMIAVLSTYIGTKIYLPTNVLQGMSAMVFFHIGNLCRKREAFQIQLNWFILVLCILMILGSLSTCHNDYPMSMVRCYYGYYPVNVIAACSFTYLLYRIVLFNKKYIVSKFLAHLGQISMLILCVHIIDLDYSIIDYFNHIYFHFDGVFIHVIALIGHLFIAIFLSLLLSMNKVVCTIFQIHSK